MSFNEKAAIRLLTSHLPPFLTENFNNDAAILNVPENSQLVLTGDMLIENIDFTQAHFSSFDIAYKALAVNLSDIAAMGALPFGYIQQIALPKKMKTPHEEWFVGFRKGSESLVFDCSLNNFNLLGGDLSAVDGPIVVAISMMGLIFKNQNVLKRKIANPGDILLVSESLGRASAGFYLLNYENKNLILKYNSLVNSQKKPIPRINLGQFISLGGLTQSVMDISDGLASDLLSFLPENLGARIEINRIPYDFSLLNAAHDLWAVSESQILESQIGEFFKYYQFFLRKSGLSPSQALALYWAFWGGEDFELLISVSKEHEKQIISEAYRQLNIRLTAIGEVTETPGVTLVWPDGQKSDVMGGFDHFS